MADLGGLPFSSPRAGSSQSFSLAYPFTIPCPFRATLAAQRGHELALGLKELLNPISRTPPGNSATSSH